MEGVECVVPDVVCDDLAAEGNITSPLPSGDTFQVSHSLRQRNIILNFTALACRRVHRGREGGE